jgi:ABC-type glycerol-3-phosphate transport system substrate-binding protein
VTLSTSARQPLHVAARWTARSVCIAAVALLALAGCGGSSSSKPAYCSARADLENSINGVSGLSPSSSVSDLEAQFQKIKTDANKVVTQAKSDFPTQTSAIKSSVDALTSAVNALTTNPSATQIATVTGAASTVLSSVKSFMDASSSKCS